MKQYKRTPHLSSIDEVFGGETSNLAAVLWSASSAFALLQYGQGIRTFGEVVRQGKKFWKPGLWKRPGFKQTSKPAASQRAWAIASNALAQEKAARALRLLDRAIGLQPRCADFYILRALVAIGGLLPFVFSRFPQFQALSQKPEADLKKALILDPNSVWAHWIYGLLEYIRRRFQSAAPHFGRVVELEPRWCWARIFKADVIYYLRRVDEAVLEFQKAAELDPSNAWAFALLGRAKNLTLDPTMNEDLDRSVELDSQSGWLYAWRGIAKVAIKQDSTAALRDFDRAKQLDQEYDRIFAWRASQLIKIGRHKEAIPDLLQALRLNAHLDITHYSLGRAYFLAGRIQDGIKEIKEAVKGSYLSIWIYNWGDWNHQNHARRQTLADLDCVVNHAPKAAWGWAWRGQTRLSLMDYDGALEDLNKAIALDSRFAYSFAWRGEVLRRLGRGGESLLDFNKALSLDKSCVWAHAWRGRLRLDAGELDSSIDDLTRAVTMNRRLGLAYLWRFEARKRLGETAKALEDIDAALEFYPTWKWLWIWRARLASGLGRRKEVLAALDEAVKISPREESFALRAFHRWLLKDQKGAAADAQAALSQAPSSPLFEELRRLVRREAPAVPSLRRKLNVRDIWDLIADFSGFEKNSLSDESLWISYDAFTTEGSIKLRLAVEKIRSALLPEAMKDLDSIISVEPDDFGALLIKADCLLKLKIPRHEEAEELASHCLKLRPDNREAHLVRHQARLRRGNFEGALEDLRAFRQGQDLRLVLEGASLQFAIGRLDKALLEAEQVLELDPFDQAAQRLRAEILRAQGKFEEARKGLENLLSLMPGLTWPLVSLGRILFVEEKPQEALKRINRALKGPATFSYAAHAWRAMALGALGRAGEMAGSLDRAIALNPSCPWLHTARQSLGHAPSGINQVGVFGLD